METTAEYFLASGCALPAAYCYGTFAGGNWRSIFRRATILDPGININLNERRLVIPSSFLAIHTRAGLADRGMLLMALPPSTSDPIHTQIRYHAPLMNMISSWRGFI